MNPTHITGIPAIYPMIKAKSQDIGFTMPSDLYIGSLLKTLVAAKPKANFLELGTGPGLALSWMVDGMDAASRITSVDNDPKLIQITQGYFGNDPRVNLVCMDGTAWIKQYQSEPFDLVFADAWPGKYSELEEVLALVKIGGLYVIDDMLPQANWPEEHEERANQLIAYLESRKDLQLTKMDWSTGIILAVKR